MPDNENVRVLSQKLNKDGTGLVTLELSRASYESLVKETQVAQGSFLPQSQGIGMGA
jgi:hypothetical protein